MCDVLSGEMTKPVRWGSGIFREKKRVQANTGIDRRVHNTRLLHLIAHPLCSLVRIRGNEMTEKTHGIVIGMTIAFLIATLVNFLF